MDQENIKCIKCSSLMKPVMTKKGVLIDVCSTCHGVWLDQGEINFFLKDWSILKKYLHFGLDTPQVIPTPCPKCQGRMQKGEFSGLSDIVEKCTACHGLYFDADEFNKLQKNENVHQIQEDTTVKNFTSPTTSINAIPVKIPSFAFTTFFVTGSLYALLFGVLVFVIEVQGIPLPLWGISLLVIGFILLGFYFAPIFLDWELRLLGSLDWVPINELPKPFKHVLMDLCNTHKLPLPRVGIIRDRSPQAYTYGRTPYSARLVFSEGMFELLNEDETETVLAHELGHIKHWDFAVMSVIKIVPLILYNIYDFLANSDKKDKQSSGNAKSGTGGGGKGAVYAALVAYIAYLIADYLVLFVSRVREYYADKFSCFATKKPNHLMKALIKISYGLLENPIQDKNQNLKEEKSSKSKRIGVEAFNIMGISHSKQLALTSQEPEEKFNPEFIKEIMRWDLWNPWAFYYELNSSHPLTAKRINAISSYALALKQKPYLIFNKQKPESYWDDFAMDLFIVFLPYFLGVISFISCLVWSDVDWSLFFYKLSQLRGDTPLTELTPLMPSSIILTACIVLGLSVGGLIRTLKAYPSGLFGTGGFFYCSVAALLKIIKVSPVRSYPVILNGQILGRGFAGQVLSEDFFFKDKTGIIFLNHEPFGLNLWFGLMHFKKFQGKDVVVKGWYRRSPNPMIEVKTIETFDYASRAYTYYYKLGFALLGILVSSLILLF